MITFTTHAQWKLTKNKLVTGGLMFTAGAAKGFNETLHFHYPRFKKAFPNANDQWFNPKLSWQNKWEDGDPEKGERFPLSSSLLAALTDQYHANNFIHNRAVGIAIVLKIGEKQKLKYYVYDLLYYTGCYQLGFAATYYTFPK